MMRKSTTLLSLLFALTLMLGVFAAPAFADPDKDESGKGETEQTETRSEEDKKAEEQAREDAQKAEEKQRREQEQAREDAQKAEEKQRREQEQARETNEAGGGETTRSSGDRRQGSASTAATTTATQTGEGRIEVNPGSAGGSCGTGTAFKIDNLRSNGTFGPITISNFTNTSFTWTSTQNVTGVLVKDGGGVSTNAGGTSGSASSLGQDISHVIFCLGGEVAGEVIKKPCDANPEMAGIQECNEVLPKLEQRPSKPQEKVLGIRVSKAPAQPAAVAAAAVAPGAETAPAAVLPFTGVQIASVLLGALGLITGGALMLMRRPQQNK